jgi:hypothetical protein
MPYGGPWVFERGKIARVGFTLGADIATKVIPKQKI